MNRYSSTLFMRQKKGAIASMGEIAFSLVLFVLVIIVFFVFRAYFGDAKIHAEMQAENAAFTCSNNIIKFMNFNVPGHTDLTYEDLLLESYVSGDFSTFGVEASKLFRAYSSNNWALSVVNATDVVIWGHSDSDYVFDAKNVESCEYRVAVPCLSWQDCALFVRLELDYKSENPSFVGGG